MRPELEALKRRLAGGGRPSQQRPQPPGTSGEGRPADLGAFTQIYDVAWVSETPNANLKPTETSRSTRPGSAPATALGWRDELTRLEQSGRTVTCISMMQPALMTRLDVSQFCISGQLRGPKIVNTVTARVVVSHRKATTRAGTITLTQKRDALTGTCIGTITDMVTGEGWFVWRS